MNAKIIRFVITSFIALLVVGCAGTKTIYKSDISSPISKIGITLLNKQHPVINQIFPELDSLFNSETLKTLTQSGYSVICTPDKLEFDNPDKDKVQAICKSNNIDGLVIPKITFIHVKNYVYFIPTSEYYDNTLELKLIDKDGNERLIVNHNTAFDVYKSVPENEVIITNSTFKATEQLINELK